MLLDNRDKHKVKAIVIKDNVVLLFLPEYSPEFNPSEKIWVKKHLLINYLKL